MTLPAGFTTPGPAARPLHLVEREGLAAWLQRQPQGVGRWLQAHAFDAVAGSVQVLPAADGGIAGAVLGVGDALDPHSYSQAPFALPAGDWAVAEPLDPTRLRALQL